jgi:predicted dehydrogenase
VKVLIVGLGSMGKRRIRNLHALGYKNIAGFDLRADRCAEAAEKYAVTVYADFALALKAFQPNAWIISTPPDQHMTYAWQAFERGISCFIEASVVDADRILELHHRVEGTPILMAPSCTMRYYPGPQKIKELILSGAIGKPLNINYQTGQYLPDWHPWENIADFYVSKRAMGGCREIVPFELTWLNAIFGEPVPLACVKSKLTDMHADIDDIYHCLLRYPGDVLANITVEVISRPHATRELRIIGSEGEIVFSADENCVRYAKTGRYAETENTDWQRFNLGAGIVEAGYINPEEPYIEEMRLFTTALTQHDKSIYSNSLLDDYRVLKVLHRLEELAAMEPR